MSILSHQVEGLITAQTGGELHLLEKMTMHQVKDLAERLLTGVRRGRDGHRRGSMEIGWFGYQIKKDGLWHLFDCEGEAEFRDREDISRRVWGRMLRLAEGLERLPEETFLALTAENAELLCGLEVAKRYDSEVLDAAKEMTAAGFERYLLIQRAKEENLPVPDLMVTLKLRVFEGQKRPILETLEEIRQVLGVKELGQALEWAMAEIRGRKLFAAFVKRELPKLQELLNLDTEGMYCADAYEAMRKGLAEYVIEMAEVLKEVANR